MAIAEYIELWAAYYQDGFCQQVADGSPDRCEPESA
jgi:hypothetical protein